MPVSVNELNLLKLNISEYVDYIDTKLLAGDFRNSLGHVSIDLYERLEDEARTALGVALTRLYSQRGWTEVSVYLASQDRCVIILTYTFICVNVSGEK